MEKSLIILGILGLLVIGFVGSASPLLYYSDLTAGVVSGGH